MGASATSEWLLARRRGTLDIVGNFYHHLVAALVDGVVTDKHKYEYADVYNDKALVRIEVKGRNSNNPFGIRVEQKRLYDSEPPFPITDTLYCLCTYNHRGDPDEFGNRANSVLRQAHSRKAKYSVLAERTVSAYLLDFPLITAMEERWGTQESFFAGRQNEPALVVRRLKHLVRFKNGTYEASMKELGLRLPRWERAVYRVGLTVPVYDEEFDKVFVNDSLFKLITVLRSGPHKRLLPFIKSKVI